MEKAIKYTSKVRDNKNSITYSKGSTRYKQMKYNIESALLNSCKAILVHNDIQITGDDVRESVEFIVNNHEASPLVQRIWDDKTRWEFNIGCKNERYALQFLTNVACGLEDLMLYLRLNIK